jgi:hypothetical protein
MADPNDTPNPASDKRAANRERKRRWRERQSAASLTIGRIPQRPDKPAGGRPSKRKRLLARAPCCQLSRPQPNNTYIEPCND